MDGKSQSLERGSVVGRAVASGQLLGVAGLQSWSLTRYREGVCTPLLAHFSLPSISVSFQIHLCAGLSGLISSLSLSSLPV